MYLLIINKTLKFWLERVFEGGGLKCVWRDLKMHSKLAVWPIAIVTDEAMKWTPDCRVWLRFVFDICAHSWNVCIQLKCSIQQQEIQCSHWFRQFAESRQLSLYGWQSDLPSSHLFVNHACKKWRAECTCCETKAWPLRHINKEEKLPLFQNSLSEELWLSSRD